MRVFEKTCGLTGVKWTLTFGTEGVAFAISENGEKGSSWTLKEAATSAYWREVTPTDIANATIAELRARVTELEGELNLTRHDLQKILFRSGCILRVDLANEAADAGEVRA